MTRFVNREQAMAPPGATGRQDRASARNEVRP